MGDDTNSCPDVGSTLDSSTETYIPNCQLKRLLSKTYHKFLENLDTFQINASFQIQEAQPIIEQTVLKAKIFSEI